MMIFGGYQAETSTVFNDLWSYCFGPMSWRLVSGDPNGNSPGAYVDQGQWDSSLVARPSARQGSGLFFDWRARLFLIFGGKGVDSYGNQGKQKLQFFEYYAYFHQDFYRTSGPTI